MLGSIAAARACSPNDHFELLAKHVPTTGFAALLDVLRFKPKHVYLTGFDFFDSGIHNVNEKWRPQNSADPIGHSPQAERAWVKANLSTLPISMDAQATQAVMSDGKKKPTMGISRRLVMTR